jgi:hypothetical protein
MPSFQVLWFESREKFTWFTRQVSAVKLPVVKNHYMTTSDLNAYENFLGCIATCSWMFSCRYALKCANVSSRFPCVSRADAVWNFEKFVWDNGEVRMKIMEVQVGMLGCSSRYRGTHVPCFPLLQIFWDPVFCRYWCQNKFGQYTSLLENVHLSIWLMTAHLVPGVTECTSIVPARKTEAWKKKMMPSHMKNKGPIHYACNTASVLPTTSQGTTQISGE